MSGFLTEQRTSYNSNRWWAVPREESLKNNGAALARAIADVATRIETAQIQRRWRSLVYYRHFSGRPQNAQFSFGMAKRPSIQTYYSGFAFSPPTFNLIATCSDVYVNRLLRQHIYLSVVPDRGNFRMRQTSKMVEMWLEAGMQATGFWPLFTKMGLDALCFGSGILKCAETLDKKIGWTRVHPDELLYENEDDDCPQSVIQRVWANREDVMDVYGTDDAKKNAIERAPSAYPAFFFGPGTLDCRDVIPLLEGWRLPHPDGRPGRHVLALGNVTFEDDPWTDQEFPFEQFDFRQLPSGIFGQGLAEILLRTNEEIDRLLAANTENLMRCGFPKWLVEEGSGVNDGALGDSSGGIVKYAKTAPVQITPPSTSADSWQQLERLINLGMQRAHISEQAVSGEQVGGANESAVAKEKQTQIDDANFAEMGGRLEQFVINCGLKMIRLAKKLRPSFTLTSSTRQLIKWNEVGITDAYAVGLSAFGMSRLPQSISGRQQLLDSMLANGTISRQIHTRFSQVPDVDGLLDRLNAPQEAVDRMLDDLLAGDDYIPPTSFIDLDYAKTAVEARYLLEGNLGTPQDKLDQFLMWRAAVIEMIEQRNTPESGAVPPGAPGQDAVIPPPGAPGPGMPIPGAFGDMQGANPALAPSPPQIPPMLGAVPGAPPPVAPLPA